MTAPADIRALAEAALEDDKRATPGPWFLAYSAVHSNPLTDEYARIERTIPEDAPEEAYEVLPETSVAHVPVVGGDTPTLQGGKDGTFIAAARTREPELARFALAVLDALDEVEGRYPADIFGTDEDSKRPDASLDSKMARMARLTVSNVRAAIARHMEERRGG